MTKGAVMGHVTHRGAILFASISTLAAPIHTHLKSNTSAYPKSVLGIYNTTNVGLF